MAVETGTSPTECGQIAAAELSMSPPVQKRKYTQPVAILVQDEILWPKLAFKHVLQIFRTNNDNKKYNFVCIRYSRLSFSQGSRLIYFQKAC
jgi:hypothetical protein